MTTATDINSIGYVAQTLQRPPAMIRRAAEQLCIEPVLCINGVAHYSDYQVETLRRHFEEVQNGRKSS